VHRIAADANPMGEALTLKDGQNLMAAGCGFPADSDMRYAIFLTGPSSMNWRTNSAR
jgi:hypothetical protein